MKKINKLPVHEFTSLEDAESFAANSTEAMQILMGDCPHYFVATLANAEKLMQQGYEPIKEVIIESGEECWELDDEDEAALEAAWAKERTPEFLARIARQAAEDKEWLMAERERLGIKVIEIDK